MMNYCSRADILSGEVFNEKEMLPVLEKYKDYTTINVLFLLKSVQNYLFGNFHESLENIRNSERFSVAETGDLNVSRKNLYHSLTLLALYPNKQNQEQKRYLKKVKANQKN